MASVAAAPAAAQVASAIGAGADLNLTSFGFVDLPNGLTTIPGNPRAVQFTAANNGDMFGVFSRNDTLAASIVDNSTVPDSTDNLGIIKSTDFDDFFGVVDTVNDDTDTDPDTGGFQGNPLVAEWVFDISSATGPLILSMDFAAIGDFEVPGTTGDFHDFEVAFDGGSFTPVFTTSVDEDASKDYTLENGNVVNYDDPMSMNGKVLSNDFVTLVVPLVGSGSSLTLRFTSLSDAAAEAFAFRNIVIDEAGDTLVGDYNNDGRVDVADYTVWRDAIGAGKPLMFGDDTPGTTIDDYLAWRNAFVNGVSGAVTAAPEPAASLLMLLSLIAAPAARRR